MATAKTAIWQGRERGRGGAEGDAIPSLALPRPSGSDVNVLPTLSSSVMWQRDFQVLELAGQAGIMTSNRTGVPMVSQNLERTLQAVKALSPDERQQLLAILETQRSATTLPTAEDRAEEALLAKRIIGHIPPPVTPADVTRHHAVLPVAVEGRPVSESLVEDRR